MTVCGISLSRSLLGVKRTWHFAPHMSAFDPKRTSPRRHIMEEYMLANGNPTGGLR